MGKGLDGGFSAESLMYTIYFYSGKLFGLRAGEHRLLDLKEKPRFIKHKCHEVGHQHDRCLAAVYSVYINKVQCFAASLQSFYFRPHGIIAGTFFPNIFLHLIPHLTSQMIY